MQLLPKELFISTIEAIRNQLIKDKLRSESIAAAFGIDECNVPTYDNSLLIKSLVSLLQLNFPVKDGSCEIEHYMFDMNFGRISPEEEVISIEDLWDKINTDVV